AIDVDDCPLSDSGIYYVCADGTSSLADMRTYVETLPMSEEPEVFGMHDNSSLVYREREGARVIRDVLNIQPTAIEAYVEPEPLTTEAETETEAEGEGEGEAAAVAEKQAAKAKRQVPEEEREDGDYGILTVSTADTEDTIVDRIAADLLQRLPEQLDMDTALEGLFEPLESGLIHSLAVVLKQEVQRFNNLLSVLKSSLADLRSGIKGLVVMSAQLESVFRACFIGQVPDMWTAAAYPSLKPLSSWFADLILRVEFMRSWLQKGRPESYWLSGFFFPQASLSLSLSLSLPLYTPNSQGFITGVLQTYARSHSVPIDVLAFRFMFTHKTEPEDLTPDECVSEGVLIHGLYLDGAYFDPDRMQLVQARQRMLFPRLPIVHFLPVPNWERDDSDYEAPLYKTSFRAGVLSTTGRSTNHIMPVDIPTAQDPSFFTKQGTALLCQLDT
ncbi:dynein heavy chain 6, axonemal, partial [Kipferlia bialata]